MAVLATEQIPTTLVGAQITWKTPSGGGDTFVMPGTNLAILIFDNQDASATTITIASQVNCDQGQSHDKSIVVAAGEIWWVQVPQRYKNASNSVSLSYTSVTSLTVGLGYI
jgi:methyl coenzyme M reductase beta subunit